LLRKDLQIRKISSKLINNVTSDFNKELFNKTLRRIFIDDCISFRSDEDIWEATMNKENYESLCILLNTQLKNLYELYLQSEEYEIDLNKIKKFWNG